jgi:hypothetical protein
LAWTESRRGSGWFRNPYQYPVVLLRPMSDV